MKFPRILSFKNCFLSSTAEVCICCIHQKTPLPEKSHILFVTVIRSNYRTVKQFHFTSLIGIFIQSENFIYQENMTLHKLAEWLEYNFKNINELHHWNCRTVKRFHFTKIHGNFHSKCLLMQWQFYTNRANRIYLWSWHVIQNDVKLKEILLPGQSASDRPRCSDVTRVFNIKKGYLISLIG